MQVPLALSLARDHRRRIDAHVGRAMSLVAGDPLAVRVPLARARWGLVQLLRDYHLFKRIEIFDPVIRSGSHVQAAHASRLRAACLDGWDRYCAYTSEWSGRDVVGCWPAYRPAMLAMATSIRDQLLAEECHLAALLAGTQRTRHAID